MAHAAPKACSFPHCSAVSANGYYCEQHQTPKQEDARGSSAQRGYDSKWRKFRTWFLSKHPLCADCQADDRPVQATEVHHVKKLRDFPELRLVESNCMPLCKQHHQLRTNAGE